MNVPSPTRPPPPGTLFLTHVCPSFARAGTQIRAMALLRMIAARGDVHVVIVNTSRDMPGPCAPRADSGCAAITYLRILPDAGTAGGSPCGASQVPTADCPLTGVRGFVAGYAREHRLEQLFVFGVETLVLVQGCLDFFPVRLLDLGELASRRQGLISGLQGGSPNPVATRARLIYRVLERSLVPRFDHVFVSSEAEAEEVRRTIGFQHPCVMPNVRTLESNPAAPPGADPREILFVGTLSYFPNQDGILWFCREVLPLLRQKLGDSVLFRIIGFNDTEALDPIRDLPGVVFSGYQADLAPFYARASLAVAPLRAGAGTRLKILEAFAYHRPVVSTTIGAEGLEVTHDEDILLADTAETFTEACLLLITQPDAARRIAEGARRLCAELYSEEALLRRYDEIMAPPRPDSCRAAP